MTATDRRFLPWPTEAARCPAPDEPKWHQAESNICLDFHGDPLTAGLVVFSDGNHHMALEESLQAFRKAQPGVGDIFYATTPPGVLVDLLERGALHLGNLTLSVRPHVFIGPQNILEGLASRGRVTTPGPFMRSRGNDLLVRRGNPGSISGIEDLLRDDVRLFISNPVTEKASHEVYRATILGLAAEGGLDVGAFERLLDPGAGHTVMGERIHHREAPQTMADGRADCAVIYHHLALRYTRIFPDLFERVPLPGAPDGSAPSTANLRTEYHIARVGDGGPYGRALVEFMASDAVSRIYASHGLERP